MLSKLFKSSTVPKSPVITQDIFNEIYKQRGNMDKLYPSDISEEEILQIEKVRSYTMTSLERLASLSRALEYIHYNNVPGDVVECGVWKGGSMMFVANRLIALKDTSRELFLFDTFEGMSEPTERDISYDNHSARNLLEQEARDHTTENIWCYSTLDEVKNNLISTGYEGSKLHFIKGKVEDTLPYDGIDEIALLRLDTDWYESTRHELETLYDKLVIGGVLIIDDYGHWSGAKKAVDEFIKERGLRLFLNRVDYTCRLAIKP